MQSVGLDYYYSSRFYLEIIYLLSLNIYCCPRKYYVIITLCSWRGAHCRDPSVCALETPDHFILFSWVKIGNAHTGNAHLPCPLTHGSCTFRACPTYSFFLFLLVSLVNVVQKMHNRRRLPIGKILPTKIIILTNTNTISIITDKPLDSLNCESVVTKGIKNV